MDNILGIDYASPPQTPGGPAGAGAGAGAVTGAAVPGFVLFPGPVPHSALLNASASFLVTACKHVLLEMRMLTFLPAQL